jgi:hypothetical protein
MARAGPPCELIARRRRQRDVMMVAKVYWRLKPDAEKRDRGDAIAPARDTDRNSV